MGVFFTRLDPKILSQTCTSSEYFWFTSVLLFPLAEEQNYPVNSSLCGISGLVRRKISAVLENEVFGYCLRYSFRLYGHCMNIGRSTLAVPKCLRHTL